MRNPFGRRLPKPPDDETDETTYGDWPTVPRPFSESTITKQPEFHPISHRRKEQQNRVA